MLMHVAGGAELIMRRPWFVGGTDLEILGKIFQAFGTPTEAQWPGMKALPNFVDFQKTVAPPLASMVKGVSYAFLSATWSHLH